MNFLCSRLQRVTIRAAVFCVLMGCARAQVTETPHTIKPGKFLVEMDGIRLSFDRTDEAGNTYDAVGVGTALLSMGMTRDVDLQAGFQLFHRETIDRKGRSESNSGLGDVTVRTKWTFWSDETAGAAAAVIPYVKVPTNSGGVGNDSVEGGVIVPWAVDFGGGASAGAMAQWDVLRNPADDGYDSRWLVSGYAEQSLPLGFMAYAEAILAAGSGGSSQRYGELGVGARWRLGERMELDYELLKGLSSRASEWTHVVRVNWEW